MSSFDYIYGYHTVKSALQTRPQDVMELFVQADRQDQRMQEIILLATALKINPTIASKNQLMSMVGEQARHQGIILKCRPLSAWHEKELIDCVTESKEPVLLLILDSVQDPHNLGACLRSANAFGVHAVIAPKDRAASITDIVRKVACGAAELTPFVAVTNLHRTLKQLQSLGVWLVGLDTAAEMPLSQVDLRGSVGLVMGSEGEGLRRLTKEACDYLAYIPMQGMVESMNVSVATGIALYEAQSQRRN